MCRALAVLRVSGFVHASALCNCAREPLQWAALEALDVRLSPRARGDNHHERLGAIARFSSEFRLALIHPHCTELCRISSSLPRFCLCSPRALLVAALLRLCSVSRLCSASSLVSCPCSASASSQPFNRCARLLHYAVAPATGAVHWYIGTSGLRHSLGRPYVTRGLDVVDRTLGACHVTGGSRHLTSPFTLIYSYKHSFSSITLTIPFWCVLGRSRLRAWGSNTTRGSSTSATWVAIRTRLNRDLQYINSTFKLDYLETRCI